MNLKQSLFVTLIASVWFGGCGGGGGQRCVPECEPGYTCHLGECTLDGQVCNPACQVGYTCQAGECVLDSNTCNPACGVGYHCESGQCVLDSSVCNPACGVGYTCEDGQCVEQTCSPACRVENGEACISGRCQAALPGSCWAVIVCLNRCATDDTNCSNTCFQSASTEGYNYLSALATCMNNSGCDSSDGCSQNCCTVVCEGDLANCVYSSYQTSTCGNGALDVGEQCDSNVLGGGTCQTQGFTGGSLSCNGDCTYNVTNCNGTPVGERDQVVGHWLDEHYGRIHWIFDTNGTYRAYPEDDPNNVENGTWTYVEDFHGKHGIDINGYTFGLELRSNYDQMVWFEWNESEWLVDWERVLERQ